MGGELSLHLKIPSSPAMPRRFYVFIAMLFSYSFIRKKHGFVAVLKYLWHSSIPFETFLWPQPKSFQDGGTRKVDSLLETTTLGLGELQGLGIEKKNCLTVRKSGSLKTNHIDRQTRTK